MAHHNRSEQPQRKDRSLSSQMKNIAPAILHTEDGVDHVNVDRDAKTKIGSFCAIDKQLKFFIPCLGNFISPRAFAAWMSSNDDRHRTNPPAGGISDIDSFEYHNLMVFAKFFQLRVSSDVIGRNIELLDKPWTSYRVLRGSQIKQYNTWKSYPGIVKSMCDYIATADLSASPCAQFSPAIMETVNRLLERKAAATGIPFVPYEQMEEKAKKEAEASSSRRREEYESRQQETVAAFNSEHSHPAQPRPPKPAKQRHGGQPYHSRYGEPAPVNYEGLPEDNPEDPAAVEEVKTVFQASSPKKVDRADEVVIEETTAVGPTPTVEEDVSNLFAENDNCATAAA